MSEQLTRKLIRVRHALWCDAWLILPEMHRTLCDIVDDHISGHAHDKTEGRAKAFAAEGRSDNWEPRIEDGVAIIPVTGVIGHRFDSFLNCSGVTSVDVLERIINEAAENANVDAIVLDIDSPGGHVMGTPEAGRAVSNATAVKPVVVSVSGLMASAAYWIGAGADAIFATESSQIGSIGVYIAFLDQSRQFEQDGLSVDLFSTGKYKGMGMPGLPLTDDQRELLQESVDELYDQFTDWVLENRGPVDTDAFQGQTFSTANAVERGLADHVGGLSEAIAYAREESARRGKNRS